MAGIALTCSLSLSACHSQESKKPSQPPKHLKSKKTNIKKISKSKQKKQKGVAGVDYPTDDGFILDKHSKILSKTDSGIVVEHDGHSHFIFYKDLKGSQFAYLIPEGADVSKPIMTAENSSNNSSGHHYVFNPADIVAEDAQGYTVRHGDHFHYILKSSLGMSVAAPPSHIKAHGHFVRNSDYQPQGRGISGLDFATSDGFKFDGKGIVGKTKDSILVDHNGHLHPISFNDLRQSGWEDIANQFEAKGDDTNQDMVTSEKDNEFQEKLEYLAKMMHLPINVLKRIETSDGKVGIEYPHGNHTHVLMLSDIEIGKDLPDPHAHAHDKDKVGMATLKTLGFDDEVIFDILHADAPTEFPSNETDPQKMKQWLQTVTKLNIGQRQNPLMRFGLHLMPNLEILGIGFTPISDMSPVLRFTKLKQLLMTQTGVKDYRFLDHMPQLEGIDLSQNDLQDLSFLSKYKQLNLVAAAGNDLQDLSPFASMPNLEYLVLSHNKITDVSPLTQLNKFKEVHIDNNQLTDLSAFANKNDLVVLDLSANKNLDLTTLKTSKLATLMLNQSNVKTLEFLENNPSLVKVTANESDLESLKGLESSKEILELSAPLSKVKSIQLEAKQDSLRALDLSKNQLASLAGVNQFEKLEVLNASGNQIETLKIDKANTSITNLDVSDNNIPLEELKTNEHNIPVVIVENFPSVSEGSAANNGTVEEKAKAAAHSAEALEQAEDDHSHQGDEEHNH